MPGIAPEKVTAIFVTRGDVDMSPIRYSLPQNLGQCVVWDNSERPWDAKAYGRFLAVEEAWYKVIYMADDDCVVDVMKVLAEYEPGKVVCNMPLSRRAEYSGRDKLIGWGSVFDADLVKPAFMPYIAQYGIDDLFIRDSERVFTYMNECKLIDVPFEHLPYADAPNRSCHEPNHLKCRTEIRRRLATLR